MNRLQFTLLFVAVFAVPLCAAGDIYVTDLTCQYQSNPLGIVKKSRFKLETGKQYAGTKTNSLPDSGGIYTG
jgi:hypothetical protein